MLRKVTAAAAVLLVSTTLANAAEINPAVVFDMGGKFDKSFNEGVFNGVEQFKKETGTEYREFEVTNETQREQALRRMAQRGADPIIGVGFAQADALAKVAQEFPDTRFAIIDAVVDLPNVRSIVFKEHEGSFLVGMIAAMKSATGKVGFVGGMDIPLIRKFACGYEQGAKHVSGDTEVVQNMTGTTPAAWNDPTRGAELAKSQFDRGVDVAAYKAFKDAHDGSWSAGIQDLGLADDGVGWALDEHNKDLITEDMKAKVEQAAADIVAGKLQVHDYTADNSCSY